MRDALIFVLQDTKTCTMAGYGWLSVLNASTETTGKLTMGRPWAMEATWGTVLGPGEAHLGDLDVQAAPGRRHGRRPS
jgi:hypothetical protein